MVDNSLLNSAWEKIQNGRGDTLSCYEVDNLRKWAIQKFTPNSEIELEEKIKQLKSENAELHERLKKAVELPAKVMIERTLVDGKFKPTQKAQAFNGRIGVVYRDEKRWKGLLVDICSEKVYDYDAAEARLAELNQK